MFENLQRVNHTGSNHYDWGWALPAAQRLLADPDTTACLPACPLVRRDEDNDDTFQSALAYWTTLDHLLRFQLGWTHLAQGLAMWRDAGADDLCPTLALVRHVWLGDGFLDWYMAWRVDKSADHVPSAWDGRLAPIRRDHEQRLGRPVGPWQLHLEEGGMHVLLPQNAEQPQQIVQSTVLDATYHSNGRWSPNEVIIFDDQAGLESGWYGYLSDVSGDSDVVDVFAKRYGHCGTYRRSSVTGRWHTAPESVHQWGCR